MDARETGLVLDAKWDERGLIQAVAVDAATGAPLMVAHMNRAALTATLATGEAHYWSRSRQAVWRKGRDVGSYPARGRVPHRLRPGRGLAARRADRPRLPHRRGLVLLPRGGG